MSQPFFGIISSREDMYEPADDSFIREFNKSQTDNQRRKHPSEVISRYFKNLHLRNPDEIRPRCFSRTEQNVIAQRLHADTRMRYQANARNQYHATPDTQLRLNSNNSNYNNNDNKNKNNTKKSTLQVHLPRIGSVEEEGWNSGQNRYRKGRYQNGGAEMRNSSDGSNTRITQMKRKNLNVKVSTPELTRLFGNLNLR